MKPSARLRQLSIAGMLLSGIFSAPVASQVSVSNYPTKPIVLLFNSTGTTSTDTELRLYQNVLKGITRATFVFDYKGGASGAIGAAYVARQPPDGHTYLATASTIVSLPMVSRNAGYDVIKDFEPVMMSSKKNFMLLVHPDAPYRTLRDYIAFARANPDRLNWADSGEGSSTHLPGVLLHSATGTKVTFVHYKAANDKLIDLMEGRVQVAVGTTLASLGYVKAGKLRPIAVTDDERSTLFPDLPTIAQSGIPELADYQFITWLGLFAPARTPAGIIGKFHGWMKEAAKDPELKKKLVEYDTVQVVNSPEEFRQFLARENSRLAKAIKAAGITPE